MLILILMMYVFIFLFIFSIDISVLLQLTFVANLSLYTFITYKIFLQKRFNPLMCTSVIFFLCFLIIAPLIQLQDSYISPSSYLIKADIAIYTNILIFFFYLVLYIVQKDKGIGFIDFNSQNLDEINKLLLIISILSLIIALPFLKNIYISSISGRTEDGSILETLIIRKVVLSFPFFCILAFLSTNKLKFSNFLVFLILFILLIIVKNPLLEKRNAIGPIYLTILYFAFSKNLTNNIKFYISNLILFVVFFPLSSILTHSGSDTNKAEGKLGAIQSQTIDLGKIIYNHFNELHYDAWSMINATIEYTERNGLTMGKQLLGSLFFFFPREYWHDKALGSGTLVGEKLISSVYGFNFFNLSSPLIAEGYINFGFFGVLIFAILLGKIFIWAYKNLQKNKYDFLLIIYTSFYMFFLLRGDLQNAIAYYIGPLVPYFILRKLLVKQ